MKLSLYHIEKQYLDIIEQLIEGEVTPELEEALAINKQDLETKSTNYAFVIKHLVHENSIIDAEIERLEKLKASKEKHISRLKSNILTAMQIFAVDKIETPIIKLFMKASDEVIIDDVKMLDRKFIVVKTPAPTEQPDKNAIKAAIKSGESVQGATLKINQNLQIK